MARQLPDRPNLDQLKHQAKDLLRAARAQDAAALARFRGLPAFAQRTDVELARVPLGLHDAQSVIAREHGADSWNDLRERVEEATLEFAAAADAFVAAWLPGTEGRGVTDVLFGDYRFVGKLSFSWPRSMDQIPINTGDRNYNPLFKYGYGLT